MRTPDLRARAAGGSLPVAPLLAFTLTLSVLGALAVVTGCSDLSNGAIDRSAMTLPAVIADPRPEVEITSPPRGAFLRPGAVAVEGRAFAAPGAASVTAVEVDGVPVPFAADGSFRTVVQVPRGVVVIRAVARDAAGMSGLGTVGILAGDYLPLSTPISRGVGIRLDDAGMDGVSKIVEDVVKALDVQSLLGTNLFQETILGFATAEGKLDAFRFADVSVSLDCEADGIHARVEILQPSADLSATVDLGGGPLPPETASIFFDRVIVAATARPSIDANGKISLAVNRPTVQLPGMRIVSASPILTYIDALLRSVIQVLVEQLAQSAIAKTTTGVDPMEMELLDGKKIDVDIRGDVVRMDARGFELELRSDVRPAASGPSPTARALSVPGSFHTPGAAASLQPGRGLHLAMDDDVLNRITHAVWATGLLTLDVDAFTRAQNPTATPLPLMTGRDVKQFFPELNEVLPDGAPINVLVDALLPPVLEVVNPPDLIRLSIAETHITFVADRGHGWETFLSVNLHLTTTCGATLDRTGLHLLSATTPRLTLDVLEAPLVRVDDRRLEIAGGVLAAPGLPFLLQQLVIPVPHVQNLSVIGVQTFPDGPAGEHASITADLVR